MNVRGRNFDTHTYLPTYPARISGRGNFSAAYLLSGGVTAHMCKLEISTAAKRLNSRTRELTDKDVPGGRQYIALSYCWGTASNK